MFLLHLLYAKKGGGGVKFQHFWKSSLPFPSFLAHLDALPVVDPALIIEFNCPQAVLWQLETELRASISSYYDHRRDRSLGRQTLSLL